MKTLFAALLISSLAAGPALAQEAAPAAPTAVAGKYLYDANGRLLGSIYKVTPAGSAQIALEDRHVTVPASTISRVDGRLTTSLSKREILNLR